ncbi:MAG: alkylation response protein AidB-like acyl-CoA dehydrogenase [Patiriisocius sp.]|jgi:alkylation response protein AidB-like acyl-CoA dehydrogenase
MDVSIDQCRWTERVCSTSVGRQENREESRVELTEDQQQFKDVVQRFFTEQSSSTAVRELMATPHGYDPLVWQKMCGEVGLTGTHIPELYGGFGFGPVELGLVAEEMGRHLYCGPFFSSAVMAGYALLQLTNETPKLQLLPAIADGSSITTLVLDDLNRPSALGHSLKSDTGRVSGTASMVLDAGIANQLFVVAAHATGFGLYLIDPAANGVVIQALEVIDPTRKLYSVTFDKAEAELLGDLSAQQLDELWAQLSLTLAHEMIGGAQYLLDSTVDYMKLRVQFGRAIGSFQSLKHRCADLLMELELAKSAVRYASFSEAAGKGETYLPSMAKAMASDVYMTIAKAAVQLRGGIGFTWEDDTHLWFKRAKSSEVLLGSPDLHRERMLTLMEGSSYVA